METNLGEARKIPVLAYRKLIENFTAIFSILSYLILYKTEDTGSFRTNHNPPRKQRWAFRDLHAFLTVTLTFKKQHSKENIHRITESYIRRITENYRELKRKVIFIQRDSVFWPVGEITVINKTQVEVYREKTFLKTLKEQKTLSNNE